MIFYEEIIAHPKNINEYSIESFFPTFFAIWIIERTKSYQKSTPNNCCMVMLLGLIWTLDFCIHINEKYMAVSRRDSPISWYVFHISGCKGAWAVMNWKPGTHHNFSV